MRCDSRSPNRLGLKVLFRRNRLDVKCEVCSNQLRIMPTSNLGHQLLAVLRKNRHNILCQLLLGKRPALLPLSGLLHCEHQLRSLELDSVGKILLGMGIDRSKIKFQKTSLIAKLIHTSICLLDLLGNLDILAKGVLEIVHCVCLE